MVRVILEDGKQSIILLKTENQSVDELWKSIEVKGLTKDHFYLTQNGKLVGDKIADGSDVKILGRLLGGKGGFGSMLRAIGAQIEKTTNREACRDLSGRRLRDINEEKRLKAWIEKQADREEEAAERKKKKLERLCAEPKHEFKDKTYEHERSILTERIDDAVEEGFKIATTSVDSSEEKGKSLVKKKGIKRKTILDDDIDSDELSSSDESETESPPKKLATENATSDETKEEKPESEAKSEVSLDEKSDKEKNIENNDEKNEDNAKSDETKEEKPESEAKSEVSSDEKSDKEKNIENNNEKNEDK